MVQKVFEVESMNNKLALCILSTFQIPKYIHSQMPQFKYSFIVAKWGPHFKVLSHHPHSQSSREGIFITQ